MSAPPRVKRSRGTRGGRHSTSLTSTPWAANGPVNASHPVLELVLPVQFSLKGGLCLVGCTAVGVLVDAARVEQFTQTL